jgi:glycosyltransferase involved in cell wall biosynthesis
VRVLLVHGMAERGGSDQALLRMVRTLPPERFDVTLAVPAPHPLSAELRAAGARLAVVPVRRISTSHGAGEWARYARDWPVAVVRLVALVLRRRADVVVTNSLHFWHGWAAALVTGRPHVWHAREMVVQSRLALAVERFLTRHFATVVVAASQAVADQLDAPSTVVVHEHPDPDEFSPRRAGRWRAVVGLPDDAPLLAVLGRFDTWKGFEVALDAVPLVRARVPGTRLVVAGSPVQGKLGYAQALQDRAAGLDGVLWAGHRDDVPDLLADADVLLVPSTEPEPYGLVVVEALASGCPVVASDAGGPVEILAAAAPGAGRLVPPGDPAALAAAAAELLAGRQRDGAGRRGRPALNRPQAVPYPRLLTEVARAGRRYRGPVPGPEAGAPR